MALTPSQLKLFLAQSIAARLPILITGAPGIAKSEVVAQACALAGAGHIITNPAVEDPTVVQGFPWPQAESETATFLPFGALARALKATTLTVWNVEDLGQASPAMQAAYMQLFLARRVNGHVLPDCIVFIATTNRRTDKAGVGGLLEPIKSRFAAIVELEPDLDDWCTWALDNGVGPMDVAHIRFRPELLSDFQPSADLTQSPSPRTWFNAAQLFKLDLPEAILREALIGCVGEAAALSRLTFEKMYKALPSIDAIMIDPDSALIPSEPAALYATATALAARANPQTFANISKYCERLLTALHGEFAALILRDCMRRDPAICQTPAFVSLVSSPLGSLISGQVN